MCASKLLLLIYVAVVATLTNVNVSGAQFRLPNSTHPVAYHLSIVTRVDKDIFDFSGNVKIFILVDQPTREIVLHAKQLTIANVTLTKVANDAADDIVDLLPPTYDDTADFMRISTNNIELVGGDSLTLEIGFNGVLATSTEGFFRSSYISFEGTHTWLAATNFKPTAARLAFPCYDEPAFKSNFTLNITHGKRYNAISNMPEIRVENADDTATTSFAQTPPISTYAFAFAISDFPYRTNTNNPRLFRYRLYVRPSGVAATKLGMKGELLLHGLEDYLKINFTLPKIDQIAIPDFGLRASASWGLMAYNEAYILFDETVHNFTQHMKVIGSISHEFSHQWFADLVSIKWWSFIWMNEGFADVFQQIAINKVYPKWNIYQYYVTNTVQHALIQDANPHTRPMTSYVERVQDIKLAFDYVAYGKAGSVIRMFLHAFTEPSFTKGLRYFIYDFSFSSVTDHDLFECIDRAVKEDGILGPDKHVSVIFSSWSNQAGYPLLKVERDYRKNTILLRQELYMGRESNSSEKRTWWLPFNYATSEQPNFDDTKFDGWMSDADEEMLLTGPWTTADWVLFNKQQSSFYRVQYDEKNYKSLSNYMNSANYSRIHVLSRSQLLDDLLEFYNVGRVQVNVLLDGLVYLHRETEYAPWVPAQKAINMLSRRLAGSKYEQPFRAIVANLTKQYFDSVGVVDVEDEGILQKYSRVMATNLACEFEVESCLNTTKTELIGFFTTTDGDDDEEDTGLPLNTKSIVLSNGVRHATPLYVELMWQEFGDVDDTDEQALFAASFGHIASIALLKQYLDRTLESFAGNLNGSEWRRIMFDSAAANNIDGLRSCIQVLWNRASDVITMHSLDNLNDVVLQLAEYANHPIIRTEFHNLLVRLESQMYIEPTINQQAKQIIETHWQWLQENEKLLNEWFEFHNSDGHQPDGANNPSSAYVAGPMISLLVSLIILLILE